MAIFEEWATKVAGWSIRPVPQQNDFGVDAYLDVVSPDGKVTGRALAVQVKCGASYFREKNSQGYVYHGDRKHLGFYMNQPLPTILLICDPENKKSWWGLFDAGRTEGTTAGWTTTIPFKNVLGADTVNAWNQIAGPYRDPSATISAHWKLNETLKKSLIVWEVKRPDIEALRFNDVVGLFLRLQSSPDMIRSQRSAVHLSIGGYDTDPRELWEIPDVCRWLKMAEPVVKYWFYFLSLGEDSFLATLHHCLCDGKIYSFDKKRERYILTYSSEKRHEFFRRHFDWLNEFASEHGIPSEATDGIVANVLETLQSFEVGD